jgi:hypothetical protein
MNKVKYKCLSLLKFDPRNILFREQMSKENASELVLFKNCSCFPCKEKEYCLLIKSEPTGGFNLKSSYSYSVIMKSLSSS